MTVPAVLRPARSTDAEGLWEVLHLANGEVVGMGSLPSSHEATEQICEDTSETVAALATGTFTIDEGGHRRLLFLAVHAETGDPLGMTGVTFKNAVPNLAVQVTTSHDGQGLVMASSSSPWTRTELDSSYLRPEARGRGLGALLSRGRLMLLHIVKRQIPATLASHIRGRFDGGGGAPFWRCFGSHFAPHWATSTEAELALVHDSSGLEQLAGQVLPITAQALDSLGAVNAASLPAFHLLMNEGLTPNGMYDPIDGGPTLVGQIESSTSGLRRTHGRVSYGKRGSVDALVSVASVAEFRVVRAWVDIAGPSEITMTESEAQALDITPDALVAVSSIEGRP